ncbi:NAD-dependent epimerase/dehydratase family protein [Chloroflexota bacterium]
MGGSGLFGRKTVYHLLQDKDVDSVTSMDLAPPREWFMKLIDDYKDKFNFVRGDVSQLEDILNALKLHPADGVVNWAFVMGQEVNTDPRLSTKVNALGMCNAFEAAKLMGANRVVYASSETVYGPQDRYGEREVTEDDQLYPSHSYAVCKLFAEIIAAQYSQQYGMNFTAVRPTIGYGHGGQSPAKHWSEIPSFAAIGKPYKMEMDGKSLSSLVAGDDLGKFTTMLIKASSSPNPAYNVGGPPYSARDLADVVRKFIPDARIEFGTQEPPFGRGGLPWLVSMEKAKKDFGFECMPIEEAIKIHINDARLEAGLEPMKF